MLSLHHELLDLLRELPVVNTRSIRGGYEIFYGGYCGRVEGCIGDVCFEKIEGVCIPDLHVSLSGKVGDTFADLSFEAVIK